MIIRKASVVHEKKVRRSIQLKEQADQKDGVTWKHYLEIINSADSVRVSTNSNTLNDII